MKLLFVHGIEQQDFTRQQLRQHWLDTLAHHADAAGRAKLSKASVEMAYYGGDLADWTAGPAPVVTAMSVAAVAEPSELAFLDEALTEIAAGEGIGVAEIAEGERQAARDPAIRTAVAMSTVRQRRLVGLVRALEKVIPGGGDLALRVVRQAAAYLKKSGVGPAVDALVKPHFGPRKTVIVAHSLGTIIAFRLLRELSAKPGIQVPLLITLGSPLPLKAVKAALGLPRAVPACVHRWLNAFDPGDPVTLGKPLVAATFAQGIENIYDVNNTTPNAHGIAGYLSDSRVVAAILEEL